MYCRYCGNEISNNAEFCSNCGKKVSTYINVVPNTLKPPENKLEKIASFLAKISLISMILAFHSYIALIGLIIGISSIVISVVNKKKHNYSFNGLSLAMSISGILTNLMIFIFLSFII